MSIWCLEACVTQCTWSCYKYIDFSSHKPCLVIPPIFTILSLCFVIAPVWRRRVLWARAEITKCGVASVCELGRCTQQIRVFTAAQEAIKTPLKGQSERRESTRRRTFYLLSLCGGLGKEENSALSALPIRFIFCLRNPIVICRRSKLRRNNHQEALSVWCIFMCAHSKQHVALSAHHSLC